MKRVILLGLSMLLIAVSIFSLTSCEDLFPGDVITDDHFKNVDMIYVYAIYLNYMDESGEEPLSYEQWFEMIHGDEFQKGIIPEIRKNDTTDFWEISYNNGKGWNDLRFKTENEEQKNCKHTFGKWVVICEGNDYFGGIRLRTCKHCNYNDYQFKVIHSFVTTTVDPTCTESGYTISICEDCDFTVRNDKGEPLGHDYVEIFCSRCGAFDDTHKHNYVTTNSQAPTCIEQGYTTYTCKCGDTYTATVDPFNHNFSNYEFDGISCKEDATLWGTCSYCGFKGSIVNSTFQATFEKLNVVTKGNAEAGKKVQLTDYFTLHYGKDTSVETCQVTFDDGFVSTKKIVFPSSTKTWNGPVTSAIAFNTTHVTKITVWWQTEVYTGQIKILNEDGETVLLTGVSSLTGQTHISVFDGFEPGLYYLGRNTTDGYISIHKIEVTLSNHEDHNNDFVCDTEGCGEIIPPEPGTALTIPEASFIASDKAHNYFTCGSYIVSGTIVDIADTQYGSFTIQDEEGNTFYIFKVRDNDKTFYGDINPDKKPKLGDYVTVLGTLGTYRGTPEMTTGYLVGECNSTNRPYHTYTATVTDPTCTQQGYTTYTCQCGDSYVANKVAPIGHSYVDGICSKCGIDESNPTLEYRLVTSPEVNTAYKFGMIQGNLNNSLYYVDGNVDRYWLLTTTDANAALDVYLEAATNGYYLYCYINDVKTYINLEISGTYVDAVYELSPSTVYTFDTESKTIVSDVNDILYRFGTSNDNTHTKVGPVEVELDGFYCQFYA